MRLHYLDILRGIAVVLMVSFQLADAVKAINLYAFRHATWVLLFWFISGFSLTLMHQKYPFKKFWLKLIGRFVELSALGFFLMVYVPFNIPNPWFYEALGSIALNSLFLGIILYFQKAHVQLCCLVICLAVLQNVSLDLYFNPFLALSFMLVGSIIALNPPKSQVRFKPLEFIGRHALTFYVVHFLLIGFINRVL